VDERLLWDTIQNDLPLLVAPLGLSFAVTKQAID
jgi:hypothetical protein